MRPTNPWPRLSRFQEHTIELPVATVQIVPRNEAALRSALQVALEHGKGVVHVSAASQGSGRRALGSGKKAQKNHKTSRSAAKRAAPLARAQRPEPSNRIFSTRRACPSCARS